MEIFNLHGECVDISIYSNLDFKIMKPLQEQFLTYFKITDLVERPDYCICLLNDNFGIKFKDKLAENDIYISKKERKIYTIIKGEDIEENILYIKRLVESLRNRILEFKGAIFFHGASISIDGKAAVFIGSNNSGKTTTILNYLSKFNCKYLSNDRTAIIMKNNKTMVIGSPTKIGIRISTLESNKKLKTKFQSDLQNKKQTDDRNRFVLSIRQLREYLNIKEDSSAILKWVFFIKRSKNGTTQVKSIPYYEMICRLKEQRIEGVFSKNIILKGCLDTKNTEIESIIPRNIEAYQFSQDGECSQILNDIFNKSIERE